MDVKRATTQYEAWVRRYIPLIKKDIDKKHEKMKEGIFPFLRATFYRWATLWPEECPKLFTAPQVLAIGDLHIENFGTWYDQESRLCWGINDFDEAYHMPYTSDLVRLATSLELALKAYKKDFPDLNVEEKITKGIKDMLKGYTEAIEVWGGAFVLEEHRKALRALARSSFDKPIEFWNNLTGNTKDPSKELEPLTTQEIPADAIAAISARLPQGLLCHYIHRIAGLGSLGRERYAAYAEWHGAQIAREAKALLPSIWYWIHGGSEEVMCQPLFDQLVNPNLPNPLRSADPYLYVYGDEKKWVVRRLSPYQVKIKFKDLLKEEDKEKLAKLLQAMGWETANIHLSTPNARAEIRADLQRRTTQDPDWLASAAKIMAKATEKDFQAWKE